MVTKVNLMEKSWEILLYPFNSVILNYILPRPEHIINVIRLVDPDKIPLKVNESPIPKSYVTMDRLKNLDNF